MADGEPAGGSSEAIDDPTMNAAEASQPPTAAPASPGAPSPPLPVETPDFVYALGQVQTRMPTLAIEKEFAQAIGGPSSAGLTDRQAMAEALSDSANRYLARQLCWVFVIEGVETYILGPRDPRDLDLLVETVRPEPSRDDLDVVIGVRQGIAPPEVCNGLLVPIVIFDQLYSFDRDSLIAAIPRPDSDKEKDDSRFRSAAGDLFDQLIQLADNAGAIDEHRALNYLAVRYPQIYATTTEQFEQNKSFTGVEVLPSRLSGTRSIVDVVFSYTHRETDVTEKQFVRVDVTEEFPFLVTKMGLYYDR